MRRRVEAVCSEIQLLPAKSAKAAFSLFIFSNTALVLSVHIASWWQPALSWRASGDRQISLSASAERAFANFRVKNVVFTGTHFCAVLSMVGERAFVNFRKFVN